MKIIISTIIFFNIFLYSFSIEPETEITSQYIFRGLSQTMGAPSVNTKVILRNKGLHVGVWASRVNFDANSTNSTRVKLLNADSEVDVFAGYEFQIGKSIIGAGYIDRRYVINNILESNISSEYYVFLNFHTGIDTTIKGSYDVMNLSDPIFIEANIKDTRGSVKSYATYGIYLKSSNAYWKLQIDSPLKYLLLRGSISFGLNRYIPSVGDSDYIFTVGYKF